MPWFVYALVSAFAAALTAILAKIGVEQIPSTLATAIRTLVVLGVAIVALVLSGQQRALATVSTRTYTFLLLSGIATGVSWLAYFRALQIAPASLVAPIDKLSLPLTLLLAMLVLHEPVSWRQWIGVAMMAVGSIVATR